MAHYESNAASRSLGSREGHLRAGLLACTEEFLFPADTPHDLADARLAIRRGLASGVRQHDRNLYIVGLADDEYHDPERHAAVAGQTVAITDADHRLEIAGDVFATLVMRAMADAVTAYAGRR